MAESTACEYDILGYRVRFKSKGSGNIAVDPLKVIDLVMGEVERLRSQSHIHTNEAVLLTALKFASDRVLLEDGVKRNIDQLKSCALEALDIIERETPTQTQ